MPRLNRIFTIKAGAEEYTETPIPWRYAEYGAKGAPGQLQAVDLPSTGKWAWSANLPIEFSQIRSTDDLLDHPNSVFTSDMQLILDTVDADDVHSGSALATYLENLSSAALDDVLDEVNNEGFDFKTGQAFIAYLRASGPTDLQLGANSQNADGTPNESLPMPSDVLRDDDLIGREVRLYPAATYPATPYVKFVADSRDEYPVTDSRFGQYFFIRVRRGTLELMGNDFSLDESDDIIITVAGHTAASSLGETVETYEGIWGEFIENQAIQNIKPASGGGLVTSLEQSATLRIRYDPRLLAARTVTDDDGKRWLVDSRRTLTDKRYIEYDLTRSIPVI